MAYKKSLTAANFTCRFGEKKVLLDMFLEIVYPAFFESPPREYSKNVFHLFDLKFKNIIENEPIIAGKFVRDTDLTRSHVLRDNQLVPNLEEMESATAARFILILSSHTLLYVPDTPHAPPLSMFRSTIQYHLKKSWARYIKSEAKRLRKEKTSEMTFREYCLELMDQTPAPDLELIELPSTFSIKQFIEQFQKIDNVEYSIQDTNHSLDLEPLINDLREQKNKTGSSEIKIIERKPTNMDSLQQQLSDVTRVGNVTVTVKGKSIDGTRISGSNQEFKISVPLEAVPDDMNEFMDFGYRKFQHLISTEQIAVQRVTGSAEAKLANISSRCPDPNE